MRSHADSDLESCRTAIAKGSKSFAFASLFLNVESRDLAHILYAWCRRVDDAIDNSPPALQEQIILELKAEVDQIYDLKNKDLSDPVLRAMQILVHQVNLPKVYPLALLEGMKMDASGFHYKTMDDLLLYCYRVAGVVGHMMCQVLGLSEAHALKNAAHLGMAMQLTNISRDVLEDWKLGRLYIPDDLLIKYDLLWLKDHLGQSLPLAAASGLKSATSELLSKAQSFYQSSDQGMIYLPFRSRIAIRAARSIYAEIGHIKVEQCYDPFAPRAIVGPVTKLRLAVFALFKTMLELPKPFKRVALPIARYPYDVLPL